MKRISRLEWDEDNEEHIARHRVVPDEVEEVCFSRPLVLRGRTGTRLAYGQTLAGRYLLVVLRLKEHGVARCVTAREMTVKEKRFYRGRHRKR